MKKYTLITFMLLAVFACDQNKKEQEQLHKEVMDVHDEVMPEMGALRKLSKGIQSRLDSLESNDEKIDSKLKRKMQEATKNLEKAHESMMEWMRQFEQIKEGTPHGEVLKCLKEQKQLIEKVRDDMLAAKKDGEYYMRY